MEKLIEDMTTHFNIPRSFEKLRKAIMPAPPEGEGRKPTALFQADEIAENAPVCTDIVPKKMISQPLAPNFYSLDLRLSNLYEALPKDFQRLVPKTHL